MTELAPSEQCPSCSADPDSQPGRYCAPLRCYCGHPDCPAYIAGGWIDVRSAQQRALAALSAQQSPRDAHQPDVAPEAQRAVQRALAHAQTAPQDVREAQRLTSRADVERQLPRDGTVMRQLLDALAEARVRGFGGATAPELARRLELRPRQEHAALVRLAASGLILETGRTRAHEGMQHVIWAPTTLVMHVLGLDVEQD